MTPLEFARKYLPNHKQKGDEIQAIYCPYCHGGQHGDKYTFAMNAQTGTFNCKRGSCSVSGSFEKLCKDHGEETTRWRNYETTQRRKNYIAPKTKSKTLSSTAEKYLRLRRLTPASWEKYGVGSDEKGNIVFPYYENGQLVMVKFRPARKINKGMRKMWREDGGKPVFWGMDLCKPELPLVITEGEIDTLSLAECGIKNVVSIPSGAEDLTCFDLCWDWAQQFKKVILWVDTDAPGQELQRKLINRLGAWRCWVVNSPRKDANEVLYRDGKEAVLKVFNEAVEVPIVGLIRLADVKKVDLASITRAKSGIHGLDKAIGGFIMGESTIWTGINASGKSTLLGQILLDAIDQGFPVCAYSGELPAHIFRYWIDLQAVGPGGIEAKYDSIREKESFHPKPEATKKIRNWYRDMFFLYDSYGKVTSESIFEIFEYAHQRYGCRVFAIDNLKKVNLSASESNYYRKQEDFINTSIEFATRLDSHIHIVAHPRKTQGRIEKMDVGGSGGITDLGHNVLAVHRLAEKESQESNCDSILEVMKNRFNGVQDVDIQLNFDNRCRRFYMASEQGAFKKYGWETTKFEETDFVYSEDQLPF